MEKKVLLSKAKQLKENIDAIINAGKVGFFAEYIVTLANKIITDAKEYYKEDLSDLEEIKTAKDDSDKGAKLMEVSVKLGQVIAVLEVSIEGHSTAFV
ncbi:hypothetical protein KAR91_61325 [Candidatus Pacearchaeota archaeon]|nr:hypothetical protein [Candidatus Pacearchaeota archaeon]